MIRYNQISEISIERLLKKVNKRIGYFPASIDEGTTRTVRLVHIWHEDHKGYPWYVAILEEQQ